MCSFAADSGLKAGGAFYLKDYELQKTEEKKNNKR